MDGNKLDLSGSKTAIELPATYKAIPEIDMEEEAVSRPKSLVKTKTSTPEVDGADEKMLPKEEKIEIADSKLSPVSDKQNGEAKLDIGDLKSAFVGLTKEELMKYANDPFWVRLRWFLFITFWLLWASMLLGAVLIIYAAPKCDPPTPRTWWEKGPLTEVGSDVQSDDFKALKKEGVAAVVINLPGDSYAKVDEAHPFVDLLKKAKEYGMNIIVGLEPGTSSQWFQQSEGKLGNFSDYYIWGPSTFSTITNPPNNWVNPKNQSAWIYSQNRKEFYYSLDGKRPQLNFRNPRVIEEFSNVVKSILNHGAAGIQLQGSPNLLVSSDLKNESVRQNAYGFGLNDFGFYTHTQTEYVDGLGTLLRTWRNIVKNITSDGPFLAKEELTNIETFRVNGSLVIDLPVKSYMFERTTLNATEIVRELNYTFNVQKLEWPLWKYKRTEILDLVTYLLPGAPLIQSYATNTTINQECLKVRNSASVMHGSIRYKDVHNKTVFSLLRVTSGNPGYLLAFNPTEKQVVVDFPAEIGAVSPEVTVQLLSEGYNETGVGLNVKLPASKIPISPHSAIVLSYVPKSKA